MKSDDITIQQIFQDRRQYMVPFYQRAYVWTLSNQWEQLWDDIKVKAESRVLGGVATPHFLGAVVLDPQPKNGLIGVDTLHIIDGQQRLTTLQFVLKSLLVALSSVSMPAFSDIIAGVLGNSNPDTMRDPDIEKFKVWPTFRDQRDYKKAMGAKSLDDLRKRFPDSFTQKQTLKLRGIRHPRPLAAIWFFTNRFEKWINEAGPEGASSRGEALATAILQDLKVVSIVLDQEDDAQVIFETLNGRGAQLYATDLIRNFIFMQADREGGDSEKLYNTFWTEFENQYWNETQTRGRMKKPRLEWFIHAALQADIQEEVDLGRLYFEYRRYVFGGKKPKSAEDQLNVLANFSKQYKELISGEGSTPIAKFGKRIKPFDITTLHPLALSIGVSSLSSVEKEAMFDTLVSYVVRRAVCGLTTKNYNNVFMSLLRTIAKNEISPDTLFKSLANAKGDASRFPNDAEFKKKCAESPIYPGALDTPKVRAILAELELEYRKDSSVEDIFNQDYGHLDIDHLMPKSWYSYWPLKDGEYSTSEEASGVKLKTILGEPISDHEQLIDDRQKCIPTLGNLTLLNLRVNRGAQHKAFSDKKELLLANTNLRLNIPILSIDEWDESQIKARSELLADMSLKIWKGLPLSSHSDY